MGIYICFVAQPPVCLRFNINNRWAYHCKNIVTLCPLKCSPSVADVHDYFSLQKAWNMMGSTSKAMHPSNPGLYLCMSAPDSTVLLRFKSRNLHRALHSQNCTLNVSEMQELRWNCMKLNNYTLYTYDKWQMSHIYLSSLMRSDYSDTPPHPWDKKYKGAVWKRC